MFKDNIDIITLFEERHASIATKYDEFHAATCADNEVRIVFFRINKPTIAIGKQQNLNIADTSIEVIRKLTKGTAVIFTGKEISFTVICGKDTMNSTVPSVKHREFMTLINDILNTNYTKSTVLVDTGSRHGYLPYGCFNALTKNEISYNGRKLVGSSFTRVEDKLVGHVMMYMEPSYEELYKYLPSEAEHTVKPISLQEINVYTTVKEFMQLFKERVMDEQLS